MMAMLHSLQKICIDVHILKHLICYIIQGILQRFDQPGYRMYTNLEALLVKAANNDKFDEGLNIVADFYKDDINKEQLKMQLSILSSNISCEPTHELHTVIKYLQGLSPPQRLLLSEVIKLCYRNIKDDMHQTFCSS